MSVSGPALVLRTKQPCTQGHEIMPFAQPRSVALVFCVCVCERRLSCFDHRRPEPAAVCFEMADTADRPLVARITKLFNLLDQDGDGALDVKEIKFFVRKVILGGHQDRARSRELATKLLSILDQDGDRSIDVLEFVEGIASMDEFAGAPVDEFLDESLKAAAKHLAAADAKIVDLSFRVFHHLDKDESQTLGALPARLGHQHLPRTL